MNIVYLFININTVVSLIYFNILYFRYINCAISTNRLRFADPSDNGMLDIAGFDENAPRVIHDFVIGNL